MKKIVLGVLLLFAVIVGSATAYQDMEFTLYAGQTHEVGKIVVSIDSQNGPPYDVTVNYEMKNDMEVECSLLESHWTLADMFPSISAGEGLKGQALKTALQSNDWYANKWMTQTGNPIPGQFPYEDGDTVESSFWPDTIAAHGVSWCCEKLELNLPGSGDLSMYLKQSVVPSASNDYRRDSEGIASYFDLYFTSLDSYSGDIIVGNWYDGWCADVETLIMTGNSYDVEFELLEVPCVDFILNRIEDLYDEGATWEEIQAVLWYYVDGYTGPYPVGGVDPDTDMVEDIIELVEVAECGDFVPKCGELTAVLIITEGKQPILIGVPVPCGECCEDTCWAANTGPLTIQFPGKNWATYVHTGGSIL